MRRLVMFHVSCFMFYAVGCAEVQGNFSAERYLVRPGAGSARVEYGSVAGYVNGYTTTPEQSISAISRANMSDSQAWVLRECYSRYGWRCNMWGYGYGGRYSRPGYTLGGVEAVEGWRAGQRGDQLAREALRGAKLSADLTLRQSDVLERALGSKPNKDRRSDLGSALVDGSHAADIKRINPSDTSTVPEQCKGKCEDCGTCIRFWR